MANITEVQDSDPKVASPPPVDVNTDAPPPPATASSPLPASSSSPPPGTPLPRPRPASFISRLTSPQSRSLAFKFFSASAQTWIGMSPLWLMGEAITGRKIGSQFTKGSSQLIEAANDIRKAVATDGDDVVVILDEKMRDLGVEGKKQTERAAEVLRAAGEKAILVVTASLDKMKANSEVYKAQLGPEVKKAVRTHGRDVIVIVDKGLKNPIVVTGITKFAKVYGIPHADALLRLASLGLSRLLRAIPEDLGEGEGAEKLKAGAVREIDAQELERMSTPDEMERAKKVQEEVKGDMPKIQGAGATGGPGQNQGESLKKKGDCILM